MEGLALEFKEEVGDVMAAAGSAYYMKLKSDGFEDLKQFMSQWFTNIKDQGFEPETVKYYEQDRGQEETDKDV